MLVCAAIMDYKYHEVYDYFWIVIIVIAFIIRLIFTELTLWEVLSLMIYVVMQEAVMCHGYGKADCHAFCSCAMLIGIYHMTLEYFILHMFITVVIMTIHQLAKKNVSINGRLKQEIPMIPYIVVAYFAVMMI